MFFLRKKKAAAPPPPKTPTTEQILGNMLKYTEGNTKALNKYEFENLLAPLSKMYSGIAHDYYKNNNGKWVAYHNRGRSMKNMLVEDIGLYGPNAFKGYLENYKANPNKYT
jgi:hypothetical protein